MGCNFSNNNIKEKKSELINLTHSTQLFSFEKEIHMVKVTKCYDGDTIHCIFKHDGKYSGHIIRMYGYNSCEITSRDPILKQKAINAKNRITGLILNKIVYLYRKHYDKYGRIVGEIKLKQSDTETINELMLEESHGVPFMQK